MTIGRMDEARGFRYFILRFAPIIAAVHFLLAACATPLSSTELIAKRVTQVLDRRGLGADGLQIIGDYLADGMPPPPPAAPPMVRELLKTPLAAADVASLFNRAVPESLRRLEDIAAIKSQASVQDPVTIADLLVPYLRELAEAQEVLRSAVTGVPIDAQAIVKALKTYPPSVHALNSVMRSADVNVILCANSMFLDATERFVAQLRTFGDRVQYTEAATRIDSPIGAVLIGTQGDDVHAADAVLIIDPGGNDKYTRMSATGGAVSVIIDLGGADHYTGSDVVVHGLSAIVDFSGNDRYDIPGSGLGAAIAGLSVILDFSGDDVYAAGLFALGAAALGLGAIVDLDGNDVYRVNSGGQGYGAAGGVGLLWDRAGNDTYVAAGLSDAYDRGGRISKAQGAAFGYRNSIGGGIGILRDDSGEDRYSAEMFAQGVGFFYGIGVLWDLGGNDTYSAVRYAQGNGVHEAIGVLRDESGNDSYTSKVGVSQGMGLDLAVGVLYDGAGNDTYRGNVLVQGAATANGIGIVIDNGGADQWHVGGDRRVWGWAESLRGLPTVGLLLHDPSSATFTRAGKPYTPSADSKALGGPLGGVPTAAEATPVLKCPKPAAMRAVETPETLNFSAALSRLAPGVGGGKEDVPAFLEARRHITTRLRAALAELQADDFVTSWALGYALSCVARNATDEEIELIWSDIENVFETRSEKTFTGQLLSALRQRPPPAARLRHIIQPLSAKPSCGVRAALLRLQMHTGIDEASRAQVIQDAQTGLRNTCLRLKIAGRDMLRHLKAPIDVTQLPTYLRGGTQGIEY